MTTPAEVIARAALRELEGRKGVGNELEQIASNDPEIYEEIVVEVGKQALSAIASAGYAVVPMEPQPKAKISDSHAMLCTCDACIVGR